jgi:crossover junction endodeoxyribonuclease RuvC
MSTRSDYWVVGVDPSLTATGVATPSFVDTIRVGVCVDEQTRLRTVVGAVIAACRDAHLVVLEGLSYGNHTGKAAERGALHWMIRDRLDQLHIPVAVAPPAARARYATGRGNSGKDAVMIACVQRLGSAITVSNNNEADAAVLLAMGLDHVGAPLVPMPAQHRAALGGVSWPDLSPPRPELLSRIGETE